MRTWQQPRAIPGYCQCSPHQHTSAAVSLDTTLQLHTLVYIFQQEQTVHTRKQPRAIPAKCKGRPQERANVAGILHPFKHEQALQLKVRFALALAGRHMRGGADAG